MPQLQSQASRGSFPLNSSSVSIPMTRQRQRAVLVVSADAAFRQRLAQTLGGLRWLVREADSGARAWAEADAVMLEAVLVDSWLPDLDLSEFVKEFQAVFAGVDIITADGAGVAEGTRSSYRQELLFALRSCQEDAPVTDTAAWNTAPELADFSCSVAEPVGSVAAMMAMPTLSPAPTTVRETALPELVGSAPQMLEVSRRIRLVAPRSTPVLIEGPTGTGKELVARALHRLSPRSRKPFVVINCAAIPEALLEAELFGHTRGAFTGAVQGRQGRIEAADGGTVFLDEIGEMPLALQSKLLRFVECGELQRVGDNETVKVDVRIVAATHRPLAKNAAEGIFRSDLYYRLAVFLIRTPALSERGNDLHLLTRHFLEVLGRHEPIKRIDAEAMACLGAYPWPGNVRELHHVLERAVILAGDAPVITASEIDFGMPWQEAGGNHAN